MSGSDSVHQYLNVPEPRFREDLFDNPALAWVDVCAAAPFRQRRLIRDGAIVCETVMTVPGEIAIDDAVDLIRGPWYWWRHGRIEGFRENADGSTDQVLSPVWWFITRVTLSILPPRPIPEPGGVRLPIVLGRYFVGTSSMDIYPDPNGGAVLIRGRFHGVRYMVPVLPTRFGEYLHIGAESGTMPFPFPKGTGWPMLRERLQSIGARRPKLQRIAGTGSRT